MIRLPKFSYRVQKKKVSEAVRIMADAGPEASFITGGKELPRVAVHS